MDAVNSRMPRRTFVALSASALAGAAVGTGPAAASASASGPARAVNDAPAPWTSGAREAANVRVSGDGFAAHIEPSLAVNPRDPRNLLAACRVFDGPLIGVASYASFDAGRTWHGTGLLPGVDPDFDGNPSVAFDAHGRGYLCAIQATTTQPRHGDAYLWYTDDGGRSFNAPVTAIAAGAGLADHPWLTIPQHTTGNTPCLYVAARMYNTGNDGVVLARRLDGAHTFDQPLMLAPATTTQTPSLPVAATAGDGTLCIAYILVDTSTGEAVLTATTSSDSGTSFTPPVSLASTTSLSPDLGNVTLKSGPSLAASPTEPRFYAAMTSFDDTTNTSSLLLTASTDKARTWNPPRTLATSDHTVYLQPQLAIDPHGRIAVSVYALSITTATIDVILYLREPAHTNFNPPLRVTTRSFDPRQAINTGNTRWLGNYQALAASRNALHPMWTDTRTGDTQLFTVTIPTTTH